MKNEGTYQRRRKKSTAISAKMMKQNEWRPVRITLVAIAAALGLGFICFVLTARGDLFSTLFHGF